MPKPTLSEVLNAIEENNTGISNHGFCLECAYQQDGVEPDAEGYTCEDCGAPLVMGADYVLLTGNHED